MTGCPEDVDVILSAIRRRDLAQRWAPATQANLQVVLAWLRRPEPGDPVDELAARRMRRWLASLQDNQSSRGE